MKKLTWSIILTGVVINLALLLESITPGKAYADPSGSPSQYKKIVSVTFTNAGSFTWVTSDLVSMYSVDMTFTNAGTFSNRFDFSYVRSSSTVSNITHILFTYTGAYHTVVWYPENNYTFQNGDRVVWTNSNTNVAVLTFNSNFF